MSTPAESQKNAEYFQAVVLDGVQSLTHFVSFSNTSVDSLNLLPNTTLLELFATQDCWILLQPSTGSQAAVANTAQLTRQLSKFLPGGIVAFIGVPKKEGVVFKVSMIRDSADGKLHLTEGA